MSSYLLFLLPLSVSVYYVAKKYFQLHLQNIYIGFPLPMYRLIAEKNVMVPMEDGVKLATDIYRPQVAGKFPVIIIRTPYDKNGSLHPYQKFAELYSSQGYVTIVQDVRGKHDSEGTFEPYINEALDGHTTITWAGTAPWSNGNVALWGFSYLGSCAWLAAKYKSPYLKTIIPMFTKQNTYGMWIDQGVPFLRGPLLWLCYFIQKRDNKAVTSKKIENCLAGLPTNELDQAIAGHEIPFYKEFIKHLTPDDFWAKLGVVNPKDLNIPALIIGGWYDHFLKGAIQDFQKMNADPSPESLNNLSHLHIGPWSHNPAKKVKGVNFGKSAHHHSLLIDTLKWCDHWLKNDHSPKSPFEKISYFIMGRNEWREASEWPPKSVIEEPYFLAGEGHDETGHFLGKLCKTYKHPQMNSYLYDPKDLRPFRGISILYETHWLNPIDLKEETQPENILTYTSEPLENELIMAGSAKLVLFVSSSAVDTDFFAKISALQPDGKSYNLSIGFIRMRFRDSIAKPVLMVPGEIYRVEITFRAIAYAFSRGQSIQLKIASSDFPVHNRNLNTGLCCETSTEIIEAEQKVYTGPVHPTQLILPILPNEP